MPYVQRTVIAGKTRHISKYYTSRYNKKGIARGKKVKATPEQQKEINNRIAIEKLTWKINTNFVYGDYHIVLNYIRTKNEMNRSIDDMKKDIKKFFRILRKEYKKRNKELKYIHIMEVGKKGARHHHLIINKIDPEVIQDAWYRSYSGHNRVNIFPLDDSGDYSKLASYFVKQTAELINTDEALINKRWSCSRNLKQPKIKYKVITTRDSFSKKIKVPKGYYLQKDSLRIGIHSSEYFGYGFIKYTLVQLE